MQLDPVAPGSAVNACWRPVVPTATGSLTWRPRARVDDGSAEVFEGEGEVLAHVVRHRSLDEVDLLPVGGVEPCAGEPEVGRAWFWTRPIFSV